MRQPNLFCFLLWPCQWSLRGWHLDVWLSFLVKTQEAKPGIITAYRSLLCSWRAWIFECKVFWRAQGFNWCHCREAVSRSPFPFPTSCSSSGLEKRPFKVNVQPLSLKLHFSTSIPFTRLVRTSWYHPAKQRHPSLGQRSQWQVSTVHTTGSHKMQISHNALSHLPRHVFPNLQSEDLIQIQRVFIKANGIKYSPVCVWNWLFQVTSS